MANNYYGKVDPNSKFKVKPGEKWEEPTKGEKATLGTEHANQIGSYGEDTGGGTPKQDGGGRGAMNKNFVVADSPDDPKAVQAKAQGKKVRYLQPRLDNGQFTYNSANRKKLYYPKSRGETVPPFLIGMNANWLFNKKGEHTAILDGHVLILKNTKWTADSLYETCKQYITEGKKGFDKVTNADFVGKKGSQSKEEKQAIASGFSGMRADQVKQDIFNTWGHGTTSFKKYVNKTNKYFTRTNNTASQSQGQSPAPSVPNPVNSNKNFGKGGRVSPLANSKLNADEVKSGLSGIFNKIKSKTGNMFANTKNKWASKINK